ncbi:MAG: export transporter permease LptG, partial [Pseudomonadota bacterium]
MRVLQKYLMIEILQAVLFVLLAFLALFAFVDLTGEVQQVGRGTYRLQHAMLYVALGLPGRVYELVPVAALIGTIYALAMLAARSEFTIMRVSGLSTWLAVTMLIKIGLGLTLLTFVFGELLAPLSTRMAERIKLETQDRAVPNLFRSGLWTKDVIKNDKGEAQGTRFLNVQENRSDGSLHDIKIYEFDLQFRLQTLVQAKSARFQGKNAWMLNQVSETRFLNAQPGRGSSLVESFQQAIAEQGTLVSTHQLPTKALNSEVTPHTISVLFADPER